jgi:hypothetical protein
VHSLRLPSVAVAVAVAVSVAFTLTLTLTFTLTLTLTIADTDTDANAITQFFFNVSPLSFPDAFAQSCGFRQFPVS